MGYKSVSTGDGGTGGVTRWVHEPLRMEQTGIGLTEDTMRRVDRLRACFGKSRAWVVERALTDSGGLDGLEDTCAEEIAQFAKLAARQGMTWQEYARWYAETFHRKTNPPTLDNIESEALVESQR